MEFNACCDKSIRCFLTCSMCVLMMGSECMWVLGDGSNFQLVREPKQNWVLGRFQAEWAVWNLCTLRSCPFIHLHGLEIAVQEHPTLSFCYWSDMLNRTVYVCLWSLNQSARKSMIHRRLLQYWRIKKKTMNEFIGSTWLIQGNICCNWGWSLCR